MVNGMPLTCTLHGSSGTLVDLLHSTHFQNERTARCSNNSWPCCGNLGGMHAHFLLGMPSDPSLLAGGALCSSVCCKLFLCFLRYRVNINICRKLYADLHSIKVIAANAPQIDALIVMGSVRLNRPNFKFQQTNPQFQTNMFTDLLIMVIPLPIIIRAKLRLKCVVFPWMCMKQVPELANASTEQKSNSVLYFLLGFLLVHEAPAYIFRLLILFR
jgi:hypothetical protein